MKKTGRMKLLTKRLKEGEQICWGDKQIESSKRLRHIFVWFKHFGKWTSRWGRSPISACTIKETTKTKHRNPVCIINNSAFVEIDFGQCRWGEMNTCDTFCNVKHFIAEGHTDWKFSDCCHKRKDAISNARKICTIFTRFTEWSK